MALSVCLSVIWTAATPANIGDIPQCIQLLQRDFNGCMILFHTVSCCMLRRKPQSIV